MNYDDQLVTSGNFRYFCLPAKPVFLKPSPTYPPGKKKGVVPHEQVP